MVLPKHDMYFPQEWSIQHSKRFGIVVHKKNQGLAQKINPKRKMMIKRSQQSSRISVIRRSLVQGRNQIKKRICQKYNASTIENMVTTGTIVLI
jgi:hypothetical protein